MKRLIILIVLFIAVFVGKSQGVNVALSGTSQEGNQAIIDFLEENFDVTVTFGDYSNPANLPADTEVLVIGRVLGSWAYANADNSAIFNALTIPVVCLTSYVARPDDGRWGWHSGPTAGFYSLSGDETVVTEAGAGIFGTVGPVDWWNDASWSFSAAGTGSVGDGQILATSPTGDIVVAYWKAGDQSGTGVVFGSDRLLFNVPDQGSGNPVDLPNTPEGIQAFFDALSLIFGPGYGPYDPLVTPENPDGSVGRIVKVSEDPVVWEVQDVFLNFKAPPDIDKERGYPVNPDIAGHYIYLQTGAPEDPNLYLYDYVMQVHAEDPYQTNPEISYGPLSSTLLKQATTYQWQIECAVNDGTGNPLEPGDPNNILGPVWSFKTASAIPAIITSPVHTLTDASGNATLTIETGLVANHYRWFKVVGQQDTAENEEIDDIMLTDSGIFSGTTTKTLFITGAASDGSDDARVYAIAYNGDPEGGGVPSAPSAAAWFWYPRLVNHYPFETTYEVEEVTITPDIVSGYDAMLLSNDTGQDIPVLAAGMPELEGDFALKFDNPRGTDPNVADAQYAQVSEGWAGGYKDITISAWVYSSGGSNWNRILDFGNDTNNYMFLCVNPGSVNRQVRFAVKVAGNEQSVSSAAEALPDNTWVHVAATLTGTTGRIYINGELAGTNTSMTLDPVSYGPSVNNWIARSQWGAGDGYFNGMLDDLKIYNYARTTEQIAQDYLAVRGGWVCNYELYDLPYDFNGDCTVDLADFAIFAAAWLDNYRIYPE